MAQLFNRLMNGRQSEENEDEDRIAEANRKQLLDAKAAEFVRRVFKQKKCPGFRAMAAHHANKYNSYRSRCICGLSRQEHETADQSGSDDADGKRKKTFQKSFSVDMDERISPTVAESGDQESWINLPTDAFGRIQFYPSDFLWRKRAKYIRLAADSSPDDIRELFVRYWKLLDTNNPPKMVLSVLGGGSQYGVAGNDKAKLLMKCLEKGVSLTSAWIITNGRNVGLTKQVGEVLRQSQILQWNDDGSVDSMVKCIGVTNWANVDNRDALQNKSPDVLHDARYTVNMRKYRTSQVPLDPYHTHFLLVDDGSDCKRLVSDDQFRVNLEHMMNKQVEDGGLSMPVVPILVEGGLGSLWHAVQNALNGLNLIVLSDTGRAADLMVSTITRCKAIARFVPLQFLGRETSNKLMLSVEYSRLKDELIEELEKLRTESPSERVHLIELEQLAADLVQACRIPDVISVMNVKAADIEMEAIKIMMKYKNADLLQQMQLAIQWDRADIAEQIVFSNAKFDPSKNELYELMQRALIDNQKNFVQLFIRRGFPMDQFLTKNRLVVLYKNSVSPVHHLWALLGLSQTDQISKISLERVGVLLTKLLRRFTHVGYGQQTDQSSEASGTSGRAVASETGSLSVNDLTKTCADWKNQISTPYHELFIWAVLVNRPDLALLFLEQAAEPMTYSLIGTLMCKHLIASIDKERYAVHDYYEQLNVKLETLATGIVKRAYALNPGKSSRLIHRPIEMLEGLNALDVAKLASDEMFVASACCQDAILKRWKGGLDMSAKEMLACQFLLFPIFGLDFDHRGNLSKNERMGLLYQKSAPPENHDLTFIRAALLEQVTKNRGIVAVKAGKSKRPKLKVTEHPPPAPMYKRLCCFKFPTNGDSENKNTWYTKLWKFYSAPMVKFSVHMTMYIIYLILYALVLLYEYKPVTKRLQYDNGAISFKEFLLYVWQFTFMAEIFRQLIQMPAKRFRDRLKDIMTKPMLASDLFAIVLSMGAFVFRWTDETFPIARLLMAVAYVVYMITLFKLHMTNSYLGPKLIVIRRMCWDLGMLLTVMVVFFCSYSVAASSLLVSDEPKGFELLPALFKNGVWEIFGEMNEDAVSGKIGNCTMSSSSLDCILRSWPVPLMLATYMLFGNILLLNMLIAIFTHIFDNVQENGEQIWRYQMFELVLEFEDKPKLPAPIIILSLLWQTVHSVLCCSGRRCFDTRRKQTGLIGEPFTAKEIEFLKTFECVCRSDFIENVEKEEGRRLMNVIGRIEDELVKMKQEVTEIKSNRSSGVTSTSYGMTSSMGENDDETDNDIDQNELEVAVAHNMPI